MRGCLPALAVLAGSCWPVGPAHAAQPVDRFIGREVVEVQLAVDGRPLEDEAARELVETRLGAPLSMREVRETLAHLFSLGLYRGVELGASDRRGGVALLYELRSLETVDRIEFRGARGVPEDALRRLIARRHGTAFLADEAAAVEDTVRGAYRERGFFTPRIVREVTGPVPRRVLRMTIEAGARAIVRRSTAWSVPDSVCGTTRCRTTGRPSRSGSATTKPTSGGGVTTRPVSRTPSSG